MSHTDNSALILPPRRMFPITPDDDNNLPQTARCFWVGESGDLRVTTLDGDIVTLPAVAAGMWHPGFIKRVWDTGTTAVTIVGGM